MTLEHEPVRSSMLPYGQQSIDEEDIQAVVEVLRGDFITQGPSIAKFEQQIANRTGASYAVAFTNGTAALHGACYAAEIGPGDEVITSPITFLASANCVRYQGGIPVFADIDEATYNINPDKIKEKISPKTKAIIPVDFSGQPVEIEKIMKIAAQHGLVVIEDAAHSLGASYKGKPIGSWADMTMFSFHPVKHITTGEGGIIVTNNEIYYKRLLLFRNHGMTKDPEDLMYNEGPWYYEMHDLGYNYRMTDMQAALGSSQLHKLDSFVEARRKIACIYNEAFAEIEGLVIPYQADDSASSWHLYVIQWKPEYFTVDRKVLFEAMRDEGIGVHVHYIPVYKQPYYQSLGYDMDKCPVAERYYATAMTLPLYPKMTDQDVYDVISAVKKVVLKYRKS
ncbi:UDP-4-amino-4,6-dideoxy-N-acetyl-beta-L-altrosamine transaminase [Paenibacillus aquistagni]|uniref:UDP-4-amino-4, 6-dideoxy-N-acetyl-beta-L-altrosamine transaminase n=1 Tax=Paenibacillus aquistagni TaxID=1852522 RepID=UPI000B506B93|nr:UDP-4-amino-4,6-dideoxy-N-acetyl-beta-L-altrosamine transaminase [Paenibacillus aquistagni]